MIRIAANAVMMILIMTVLLFGIRSHYEKIRIRDGNTIAYLQAKVDTGCGVSFGYNYTKKTSTIIVGGQSFDIARP